MFVRDVMTRHAVTVDADTNLREAAKVMRDHGVGGLPVSDEGTITGFVTDRDVVIRGVAADLEPGTVSVREVMTQPVRFCSGDEDLGTAVRQMAKYRIRRLVVLDDAGQLSGILALEDVAARANDNLLARDVLRAAAKGFPLEAPQSAAQVKYEEPATSPAAS